MVRLKKKTNRSPHTVQYKFPESLYLPEVSARRYQDIFDNASDAIFIRDLEGNTIEANEAAVTLTGYTYNELTRINFSDFLTAESYQTFLQNQKALLEDKNVTRRYELEIIRKDGARITGESRTSLLTDRDSPLFVQCIIRDINERKRIEEERRIAEQNFRNSLDNSPLGIRIYTAEYELLYANKAILDICGESTVEGLKDPLSQRYTPESYAEYLKRQEKRAQGKYVPSEYEVSIVRKDGEIRHLHLFRKEVIWNGERQIQALYQDVTDRKRVERTLTLSEERFRIASQIASDVVYERDLETGIATFYGDIDNPLGYELGEYPRTMEGWRTHVHPEDLVRIDKQSIDHLVTGTPYGIEYRMKKKDGTYMTWWDRVMVIRDEKTGKPIKLIGAATDITKRKQAEKERRIAEQNFRNSLDNSPLGIRIYTAEYELLYANKAILDICGESTVEGLKDPLSQRYTPESYAEYLKRQEKRAQGKYVPSEYEASIVRKDGEIRHLQVFRKEVIWNGQRQIQALYQDITERKRVEEELRIAEQNFRNSMDDSPLGIRIYAIGHKTLYANQAMLDICGESTIKGLQSKSISQRYTPDSYAEYQERVEKRKRGEFVPSTFEVSIVRKDGEIRHLQMFRKEVIWNGKRKVQALYQDITERKRIEEELRIAEQNFRNSLDNSPLGIRIYTAEYELLYANKAILDICGESTVEGLKDPLSQRYTPESYAEYLKRQEKRAQGKYVPSEYEVSIVRKDGEIRHLQLFRKEVIWNGQRQFQTLFQDITERKRAEMELWQSEEFNSGLLNNCPSPILVLNADASIKYVNPALEKLTGFSTAELIGIKPPYPWWIEETRKELQKGLAQAMRRGHGTSKSESLFRKKNGELFWVEKIFKTVRVNGEFKYHLVNWIDLTEHKRLKANMEFYRSQITRAQEAERKRIAREIHDESVQSLCTLALRIDAIAREKERIPEDVVRRLKGIRTETNSILDGLRRFSHELRPGVIDQIGLVPALEILIEEMNKGERIKTRLEIVGSEQRLTSETELALFRIAQEALNNVKRHSRAKDAVIRLRFNQNKVKLLVSDNGGGYKLPDELSDFAAESKLGLIGIQERTRLLNGKLRVRSGIGKGTTILVEVTDIG